MEPVKSVVKATLDTNALRDLAWALDRSKEARYRGLPEKQGQVLQAFERILQLRDEGRCELGVTTQLYSDFAKSRANLPQDLQELIGDHVDIALPSVFGFPLAFPTVFADKDEYDRLFVDVFPHSREKHKKFNKNRLDAWQLYAHKVASRDVFITSDKGILRMHPVLMKKWSIRVQSPEEFVRDMDV